MLDIQNPKEARKIIRDNKYTEQTAGTAYKYVQGNLCILPSKYASDFESFCKKNPKPCPLIGLGTKGDPYLKDLGEIDIRTDVPQYRIWKKGELIDEPFDINKYWNDDLVTFVLGCSMSFELPLIEDGIPVVVLAPRDNYYQKTISNMQEVIARGAKVLLITNKSKDEVVSENIWQTIEVENANDDLLPFLLTIPLQKLAYYSALKKGYDIDKPRNLAKSVTVE